MFTLTGVKLYVIESKKPGKQSIFTFKKRNYACEGGKNTQSKSNILLEIVKICLLALFVDYCAIHQPSHPCHQPFCEFHGLYTPCLPSCPNTPWVSHATHATRWPGPVTVSTWHPGVMILVDAWHPGVSKR